MFADLYKVFIVTVLMILGSSNKALWGADHTVSSKYFHSGKILSAQITKNKPPVQGEAPYALPVKVSGTPGYASVVVVLDYMRTIGLYDYSLKDQAGNIYKCIAIAQGNKQFNEKQWYYPYTKKGERYSLLFKVSYPSGKALFNLHFNYSFLDLPDIPLEFRKLDSFLDPTTIPINGILGEQTVGLQQKDTPNTNSQSTGKSSSNEKDKLNYIQRKKPKAKWMPNIMSTSWKEQSWNISIDEENIDEIAGIRFKFTKGDHMLMIRNVKLIINGTTVAEDNHLGKAGGDPRYADYIFAPYKIPNDVKSFELKAEIRSDAGTNSYGNIFLLFTK